jgi:hypothetical protein
MSNGSKGNFGSNLTSVLVALIGAVSAIGGAWITTYGAGSASQAAPAPAVTIPKDTAQVTNPIDTTNNTGSIASTAPQPSTENAPAPAAPQPSAENVTAPVENLAPAFLPNSKQIGYNQPWPNESKANHLILQAVEIADNVVRVHLLFDNTSGNSVKFYTSLGAQGVQSYIYDKKAPQYPATSAGGDLFADPTVVEIPAGTRKQGWLEYTTGGEKFGSVNLYLEQYTEGYPAGQSGMLTYRPLKLKVDK